VLPKKGICKIFEHKSPLSIDQRVCFWDFEQILYIKCGLLKFGMVSQSKKIKKVPKKYGIFQFSEHKSTTSIG